MGIGLKVGKGARERGEGAFLASMNRETKTLMKGERGRQRDDGTGDSNNGEKGARDNVLLGIMSDDGGRSGQEGRTDGENGLLTNLQQ